MRLSLMKAAHVALFGTAYRKYRYLPGFGRCGIPRLSTGHSLPVTGLHVHGHLHLLHSGAEVCGIPHLPKPGRYPYFLYAVPKSATCAAFIKESRMEFLEANQLHRKYGLWGTHHSLRTRP
jgi:hypothetical protein